MVFLEVSADLQVFALVDGLSVDLTHPVLRKVFLEVELYHPVLYLFDVLEPLEVDAHLLLLTKTKVLYNVTLLVLWRFFELQSGLQ